MQRIIWLLFLMVLAGVLAVLARSSSGNVAILLPPYRIDVSVNVAVALLALTFAGLYLLLSLLSAARRLPERSRAYRAAKQQDQAMASLAGSIKAFLEGRFARAEQLASRASNESRIEGVAALVAARAASQLAEHERADKWLMQARTTAQVDAAADVVQAEVLLEARAPTEALEHIERLHKRGARHVHTLRLKLRAASQLDQFEEIIKLTRRLEKHRALHSAIASKTRADAYKGLFERLASDAYGLTGLWQQIPTSEKTNPLIALYAANAFNKAQLGVQSKMLLEAALAQHWDTRLVQAYAQCLESSAQGRIAQAEQWLERHPQDPALLTTLGTLCIKDQLWGKAQQYLESSLAIQKGAQPHLLLATIAEQASDTQRALEHYKAAALLAVE